MKERTSIVIVMGVAGAGKTTVSRALAESLGWDVIDADTLHSAENVAKMRAGVPLTDVDRAPWLAVLRDVIAQHLARGTPLVLACSALRESYRQALMPNGVPHDVILFVQLDISPKLAAERLATRSGHFMPASLVESQFATLEAPRDALRLDATRPVAELVAAIKGSTS